MQLPPFTKSPRNAPLPTRILPSGSSALETAPICFDRVWVAWDNFCFRGTDETLQLLPISTFNFYFRFTRTRPGSISPQSRRLPFVTGIGLDTSSYRPFLPRGRLLRLHHGPHLRAAVREHQQSRIRLTSHRLLQESLRARPHVPGHRRALGRYVLESPAYSLRCHRSSGNSQ